MSRAYFVNLYSFTPLPLQWVLASPPICFSGKQWLEQINKHESNCPIRFFRFFHSRFYSDGIIIQDFAASDSNLGYKIFIFNFSHCRWIEHVGSTLDFFVAFTQSVNFAFSDQASFCFVAGALQQQMYNAQMASMLAHQQMQMQQNPAAMQPPLPPQEGG